MRNTVLLRIKRQNDRVSFRNRLESSLDFFENRIRGNCHCFFSGNLLCQKSYEAVCDIKRTSGRTSYHAACAASHSGRILSSSFI